MSEGKVGKILQHTAKLKGGVLINFIVLLLQNKITSHISQPSAQTSFHRWRRQKRAWKRTSTRTQFAAGEPGGGGTRHATLGVAEGGRDVYLP